MPSIPTKPHTDLWFSEFPCLGGACCLSVVYPEYGSSYFLQYICQTALYHIPELHIVKAAVKRISGRTL